MPSNEQVIVNLRTVVAADLLNPSNPDLSDSGRLLTRYAKQWLQQFVELLQHKNSEDQIQDFIWFLSRSRISVNVDDIAQRASKAKAKADTAAGKRATVTCPTIAITLSSDLVPIFRAYSKCDSTFPIFDMQPQPRIYTLAPVFPHGVH